MPPRPKPNPVGRPSKYGRKKVSPADVLRNYPGGVSPHKHYAVRMDDEIVDHARLLYFVVDENLEGVYSLDAIATTLKRTYPVKCNRMQRMTIHGWIKKFEWKQQRQGAIDEAYREARGIRERQEVYKKIVTGKYGLELAELSALIHKPASGMSPRDIQKDLRENERQLLEATQNRLGLVLVELRSLNGTAFGELTRRGPDGNLLYRPRNRKELVEEYRLTSELMIRLYGIHLLQKMAGINPDAFKPDNPQAPLPGGGDLTDDILRSATIEFPPELAQAAMRLFNQRREGGNNEPSNASGSTGAKNSVDGGAPDESDDAEEAVEVEPAED